jgi:penicillin-binding protein 2
MLIFDQLKKNDPHMRVLTALLLGGLAVLVTGLWWVQIVSSRDYQANLEMQSFRTVRVPAVRGRIVDRQGTVLAENQPTYNVTLYLDELRERFSKEYARIRPRQVVTNHPPFWQRLFTSDSVKTQYVKLRKEQQQELAWQARTSAASNVLAEISQRLRLAEPLSLDVTNFRQHYETRLALPFPVLKNLDATQIARFEEQLSSALGLDLELQSTRVYPFQSTAAHVLGCLAKDDSSAEGEEAFFSFRMPDYRGLLGVEAGYDKELRGRAGAKTIVVNNFGYRQAENVWTQAEPGANAVLTINIGLQKSAERAMTFGPFGQATRGAAVVMDVHSGDILAMVSAPAYNPNHFVDGVFPPGELERLSDTKLRPQRNRATQEIFEPGSIFKPIIGLAALEQGLNPKEKYVVMKNPKLPSRGIIYVSGQSFRDLAEPGEYDFPRALKRSSNAYFIANGLRAGIENIIKLAQRLHLGETTGLKTHQESKGNFPTLKRVSGKWFDGDTANICIGQGEISVTPLQMTVMTAAIANGGKVLWPRLVDRLEPQNPAAGMQPIVFPSGRVRDELGVQPRNLEILKEAMLADVQDGDGTGKAAAIPGFTICGKTGTAQVSNAKNEIVDHTTWFVSFAPYENPRYAVVVMVEGGSSGGGDCAPIARNIYQAILDREKSPVAKAP